MKKVNLVFGTVYGGAQFVAETLQQALIELGRDAVLYQPEQLSGFVPPEDELLLLVCSTTGQGDLPEDIQPWFNEMQSKAPYLPNLKFGLIALGDSSYETYCGAGEQLLNLFEELGAKLLGEFLKIDAGETMEPEVEALTWLPSWNKLIDTELAA
ncbi:flavodoxin/nitric oxide synthase [Shewanella halifaxensis HAW-EB4]|uniref:Flavodoxin/nitric oxide synthase n=1 Tax=Shewanella halifaxensis (strain HAW-EB4) TaxID=458817 RepID=B0TP89_SHEHH|nr:flavodoxin [Shewanella halifaxensis]ABZ77536.1 flavodoxin/nitric oxide synthase [Shewanella halifaxensis HAW-EB4]